MPVFVQFDDTLQLSRATLTVEPSWLGKLFGRRRRVARIYYRDLGGPHLSDWLYEVDDAHVEPALVKIVNERRRWEEEPAQFVSGRAVYRRKRT
jgi:hypothetical protein